MNLIESLIQKKYLKSPHIIEAFMSVDRRDFLLPEYAFLSEVNSPIGIGYGQTNSQPLTVAVMLELLEPREGQRVLDVGSGSGWTVALLARIVGKRGKVFGLERIKKLTDFAIENVDKYSFIKDGIVKIYCQDGYKGLKKGSSFDRIIVSAAATEMPEVLLRQLKIGGRMVIPIGKTPKEQSLVVVNKLNDGIFEEKTYPGFVFVPMVKEVL